MLEHILVVILSLTIIVIVTKEIILRVLHKSEFFPLISIQTFQQTMKYTLTDSQQMTGKIGKPVDKKGISTTFNGVVNFKGSDDNIAIVTTDSNTQFTVKGITPGTIQVTATGGIDGNANQITTLMGDYEIIAGPPVKFPEPVMDDPIEQPEVTQTA